MKGLLYYTDNQCQERILQAVRSQINKCLNGNKLISVSQHPIDFGDNTVLPLEQSILSMFKQILFGLELLETEIVFFVEQDVLYHPSHFDFIPPKKDVYYFNTNVWMVDSISGKAVYYDNAKKTSGLIAYRDILLEHYRNKVEKIEDSGFHLKQMGYEPGKKLSRGREDYEWECFKAEHPNVDIKHNNTLTRGRFKLKEYRDRRIKDSWIESYEIPYWGKTKPFNDFLRAL